MQPIRVTLFGAPQVEVDGAQPAVSRRKVLALLAYLACTGRAHSRDELLALLWPDYDPSSARANLRRDLSRLNQWLAGTGLEANRLQVRLDLSAGLWVDVNEFRTHLAQVQKHAHSPGELCPECLLALTQATELYQDHFMAGFGLPDSPAFDEWQFFEANSLRQELAGALQRLIGWYTSQREYDLAIPLARRWLALDSLHEPAQRELMSLYALAGQQAAALRQYQECARLLKQELGLKPEKETTELYEAIRTRKFPADRQPVPSLSEGIPVDDHAGQSGSHPPPHNLPVQMTATLGREDELSQILASLKEDPTCRLMTLTGPGGSGKTRLAIQAGFLLAEDEMGSFPDGIWFVQLAPLADADSLPTAVAEVLDFSFLGETALRSQQLFDHLRLKRLVLILDNFEHLLDEQATGWVKDLLQTAPQVKILSTSRTRLNILGEQNFEVQGLQVPADSLLLSGQVAADELLSYSAVQLFLEAGKRQQPDFEINSENQNDVVRICRLVEGVPLGIELAAAWLDMLSPAGIASEIEHSLDFLEAEWASLPERQRSLRAVFNGSWLLLDPQEQSAMKCLSVFPGSVTIQAAQAVSGASIKILRELVHKSWLKHTSNQRFQVHELLRQYAAEQLQTDSQEAELVAGRYIAYYAAFLEEQARLMRGPRQEEIYQSIGVDFENLRLAWKLCLDQGRLDLAIESMLPAIFFFCEARLRAYDLFQFIDLALHGLDTAAASAASVRNAVILQVARAGFFRNGYPVRFEAFGMFIPADESAIQTAWFSAQQAGIQADLEVWSIYLGYLYGRIIERHAGADLLRSLVDQYQRQDREWELAFSLYSLGNLIEVILFEVADTPELRDETERCLLQALSIYQARGDRRESANTQRTLGNLYRLMAQDGANAFHHWRAARTAMIANGDWALAAGVSWQIGDLHLRLGEFEAAFEEFSAMTRTYHERGYPQFEAYSLSKQSLEASRHGDLDHARTLRMQALEISHRTDDLYGEAWSSWELGEIYRLSGDLPAARTWFETAQRQFERFDDQSGSIFYQRGLGDLALAEGDYRRAFEYFQESLDWAQRLAHDWGAAYALAGIGRAALGLDHQEEARKAFSKALRLTQSNKVNDPGLKLIALNGLAGLAAASGNADQAATLASLVAMHPLSWQETRRQAQEILERLPDLPAERRAELAKASKEIDLLEFTQQILAGMANMDGGRAMHHDS